jgi:hypothetical protein
MAIMNEWLRGEMREGKVWSDTLVLVVLVCGLFSGCQPAGPKAAASPAPGGSAKATGAPAGPSKVVGAVKEVDLTRVELTPEAEGRLGLTLVEVQRKPMARAVSYGGEVMIPPVA